VNLPVFAARVPRAEFANPAQRINRGTADACFGFDSSTNIGKVSTYTMLPFSLIVAYTIREYNTDQTH